MKSTIVFFDVSEADRAYYPTALEDHPVVLVGDSLTDQTVAQATDADAISVRNASKVTAELMKQLPKLRHIALRITGFDNVDMGYAREHHITVSTVPAYGVATVAEYAFMMLLALTRQLHAAEAVVRTGQLNQDDLRGHDLDGKTLGILGAGRIGQHAARIARGFGLTVLAYDAYPNAAVAAELGFTYADLDDVLARSDYLTLHAPATSETYHLLNSERLAKAKAGVFIVNTGRGTLIDTIALVDALADGQVAGAALDVVEGEEYFKLDDELKALHRAKGGAEGLRQIAALDTLVKLPNTIITTHNAYNTVEALGRIRDTTAANLRAWQTGQPQNLVPQG